MTRDNSGGSFVGLAGANGLADAGQMPTKETIIHGLQHTILGLRLDSLIREVRSLVGYLRALLPLTWPGVRFG